MASENMVEELTHGDLADWDAVPNRALKLMKGHSKGKRFRS